MPAPIKITSDCIQCGTCVASYPDIFEFSPDGTLVQIKPDADFTGKDLEEIKKVCPNGAIVDTKEGKEKDEKKQ